MEFGRYGPRNGQGDNNHQRVAHERVSHQGHPLRRAAHDRHVGNDIRQLTQDRFPVRYVQINGNPGLLLAECCQYVWTKYFAVLTTAMSRLLRDALHFLQHRADIGGLPGNGAAGHIHFASSRSEKNLLTHVLEQRHAHFILELFDLSGNRGLGQVLLLSSAGEAYVPSHCI